MIWNQRMSRSISSKMLILITLIFIWTCANERAITGGPADKTAPYILYSTPENESVNVDPATTIFIKFSEQMKKATFAAAVQIWPRPPGDYELKSDWTSLKITFNEPLDKDVTYLLTLDKNAQDLRGNGLESTYVLAFSTGADLNAGRLVGYIHGPNAIRKNGDLLLYRQFDTPLNELRALPADYIFQPDDDGKFELPYLAERSYTLFYHWDRNRNKRIDDDDYFGRPEQAAVFARSDSLNQEHKIWPHLRPLSQLTLLDASELAEQLVQVRINRPVTRAALDQLELVAQRTSIPILGATTVKEDEFAVHLNTALPIADNAQVWLKNFQDTSGFMLNSDTLNFKAAPVYDTLNFESMEVLWLSGTAKRYPAESSSMLIRGNLPFTFKSDSAFSVVDAKLDSVEIPGLLQKRSSMAWEFVPDTVLADGHSFQWQIETRFMHSAVNYHALDSLMHGELATVSIDSLGSLRVLYRGSEILECEINGEQVKRSFRLESGTAQLLEQLPAQQYTLSAYVDRNGDGRYNSGGLGPVTGAEPFWIYPSKIRVRARWETDLGEWELD